MNKLQELYAKRDVFLQYGSPVPATLAEEIKREEDAILSDASETIIGHLPSEITAPQGSIIVVGAEYVDGKLTKTAIDLGKSIEVKFANVSAVEEEPEEIDESDDDNLVEDNPRKKSIGFTVKFADGKEIHCNTAVHTMIEALRYMGFERASLYMGETFKGYPLIGRKQRHGGRWQKNVDGWWIYVNMGNDRKMACLEGIAEMLNIPMEIVLDQDTAIQTSIFDKPKGTRGKYSLNGSTPLSKKRSVWETVKRFLKEMPSVTFEEVKYQFPSHLQGSYGVVRTLADINQRAERNKTEKGRWFLDEGDILTTADGEKFAVSTQWGDNFADFQEHIKKELDWTLEEA